MMHNSSRLHTEGNSILLISQHVLFQLHAREQFGPECAIKCKEYNGTHEEHNERAEIAVIKKDRTIFKPVGQLFFDPLTITKRWQE